MIARGNRNYENYFINGRYIKSSIIAKAIEDGLQDLYDAAQISLYGPAFSAGRRMLLDVNVHPTKMELRFTDQEGMYRPVYETVRNALVGRELIPDVHVEKRSAPHREEPRKKRAIRSPSR